VDEDRKLLLTWPDIHEFCSEFSVKSLESSIMDRLFHEFDEDEDPEAEWELWNNLDWDQVVELLIERTNEELPVGYELTTEGLRGPAHETREGAEDLLESAVDSIDEFEVVKDVLYKDPDSS